MQATKTILVLVLGFIPIAVPAQDKGGSGACRADAQRFCAQTAGGGSKIMDCLIDHQKEISDGCYDFLKARLSQQRGGADACKADVSQLCKGVEAGGGRIVNCLIDHQKEISDGCYDFLKKQKSGERNGGAESTAGSRAVQPAGPIYRSRLADGSTLYSDTRQPNASAEKEVPLDRVITVPPPR